MARYLTENMVGTLHEQSGRLLEAQAHYRSALEFAEQISYPPGVVRAFHNLGNVASRQQQIDEAILHCEASMATYEKMGDRTGTEVARSGLVAAYMQAPRYAEAIEAARQALTFFQAMGDSFYIGHNPAIPATAPAGTMIEFLLVDPANQGNH